MEQPDWATAYSTETLERALAQVWYQRRDPARIFDVPFHVRLDENERKILDELVRREEALNARQ